MLLAVLLTAGFFGVLVAVAVGRPAGVLLGDHGLRNNHAVKNY